MKRKKEGITTGGHKRMNDKQLKDFVELSNDSYQRKLEYLMEMGVPTIRLDMSQRISISIKKSMDFLSSF